MTGACPLCREQLEAEALLLSDCPECRTTYHQLCLDELGGCSRVSCARQGQRDASGEFAVSPERWREIRQQILSKNKRWAHMFQVPDGISVEQTEEALVVTRLGSTAHSASARVTL